MTPENHMPRRDAPRVGEPVPGRPAPAPHAPVRPLDDRSLGDLFTELTHEVRTLVRQEVDLAKTEAREKAAQVGRHVGYIAAGGLVAYVGLFAIVAGLILLLGLIMPYWLSALLVGLVVAAVGYAFVQNGLRGLKETNISLERTAETLKEDKQWLKEEVT